MTLRSAGERLWQGVALEFGGLTMVMPVYGMIMGASAVESVALVAAVAAASAAWSPLHDATFDWVEWRQAQRVASDRPARWRLVHAISHEATATIVTLPVIMLVGGHGFLAALAIDVAMTLFCAGYTYAFYLGFDCLRPVLPAHGTALSAPAVHPRFALQWQRDPPCDSSPRDG